MKHILVVLAFSLIQMFGIVSVTNAQWVLQTNEPANTQIEALAVSGANLFTGGSGGVWRSTDSGANWSAASNGLTYTSFGVASSDVQALAVIGPNSSSPMLFASTEGGGVFRSTDNGANWTAANNGITDKNVWCLAVSDPNAPSPMLFAGTYKNEVFRSSDKGASWTMVYNEGTDGGGALAVNGTNIFLGFGDSVSLSTNNGTSWTGESIGLFSPSTNSVTTLAVSGTTLVAGTSYAAYRSTNNGASWTQSTYGLLAQIGNDDALAVIGSNLFMASEAGVYLSTDEGINWKSLSEGFGIDSMDNFEAFAMNDTFLYVADFGYGVWRRPLSEMIAPSSAVQRPDVIQSGAQVYPNPFPAKTTITVSATESGVASVTVVNLLGQEVAHLFEDELTAGQHFFTWDASNVPPGSYWCVARMGDRTERISLSVQR